MTNPTYGTRSLEGDGGSKPLYVSRLAFTHGSVRDPGSYGGRFAQAEKGLQFSGWQNNFGAGRRRNIFCVVSILRICGGRILRVLSSLFPSPKRKARRVLVGGWRDRGFWLLSLPWPAIGRKGNNLVADCFGLDEA